MADGSIEGADTPRTFRDKTGRFLGSIPTGYAQRNPDGAPVDDGPGRENARSSDAGTIDPVAVSGKRGRGGGPGRGKWTPEQHAADRARRAAAANEADAKSEKVAVTPPPEPPLPDPTLLGFATQGLIFFNAFLAARTGAPEFAAIPADRAEMVATAWLKFIGYYVSIAKVSGPMGALAAALMATAFVYGPVMMSASQRRSVPAEPMVQGGPSEGAESMFAAAMPPVH